MELKFEDVYHQKANDQDAMTRSQLKQAIEFNLNMLEDGETGENYWGSTINIDLENQIYKNVHLTEQLEDWLLKATLEEAMQALLNSITFEPIVDIIPAREAEIILVVVQFFEADKDEYLTYYAGMPEEDVEADIKKLYPEAENITLYT